MLLVLVMGFYHVQYSTSATIHSLIPIYPSILLVVVGDTIKQVLHDTFATFPESWWGLGLPVPSFFLSIPSITHTYGQSNLHTTFLNRITLKCVYEFMQKFPYTIIVHIVRLQHTPSGKCSNFLFFSSFLHGGNARKKNDRSIWSSEYPIFFKTCAYTRR